MTFLLLLICITSALSAPVDQWDAFKQAYGKLYASLDEYEYRQSIFVKNLAEITEHNKRADAGEFTYWKGVNQFTDWTEDEFRDIMLMKVPQDGPKQVFQKLQIPHRPLPSSIDWRTWGHVTSVKNQGSCGASWAFAAVANIESLHSIQTGQQVDMSEQQLIDCDLWNQGCEGGIHYYGYKYIMWAGGIVEEKCYPYTAKDEVCYFDKVKDCIVAKLSNYTRFSGDDSLRSALNILPVSVGVDAGPWKSYRSGIFDDPRCTTRLNHSGTVVGYNDDAFIIKNSWGSEWGEQGYIRLARGPDRNVCGVCTACSYPVK